MKALNPITQAARLLAAATALALGLQPLAQAAESVPAEVHLDYAYYSPVSLVLRHFGWLEKALPQTKVTWVFSQGSNRSLEYLNSGGVDFASSASLAAVLSRANGSPIKSVYVYSRAEWTALLVRKGSPYKTLADLKGKKIAYTAGTGSEVYTAQLLKKAGLKKDDVTLVNLRPQDMLAALAAGSIDAFDSWEPHIANAKKALGDKVTELDTKGVYSETFNIVVMQPYLTEHPQTVEAFLAALIEAETWAKANPAEAVAIVAKAVGMKPDELQAIWGDYTFHVAIGEKQLSALKTHAQWRLDTGNHPPGATMPDFSKVVFPETLRKLDAARVTGPQS